MKATTLITHGIWAALAVAAFVVGLGSDPEQAAPAGTEGDPAGAGMELATVPSGPVSWTCGPGDRPEWYSAEVASVLSETDEEVRRTRAAALLDELTPQVLEGLTEETIPGLLETIEAAGGFEDDWYKREEFLKAWVGLNPAAAFAYTQTAKTKLDYRSRLFVLKEWAKIDPEGVPGAVFSIEDLSSRWRQGNNVMYRLADSDLDVAIAFAEDLQRNTNDGSHPGAGSVVKVLHRERGVEGVQEWLDGLDYGEATDAYKRDALDSLGYRQRGDDMIEILVRNGSDPFVNSELLRKIADERPPQGVNREHHALDWLVKLPPEVGPQRQAIGEQFENYLKKDFESAGAWLAAQKLGPQHDQAIEIFVRNATMDEVPAAMRWAEQISEPALRTETIQYVQERGG